MSLIKKGNLAPRDAAEGSEIIEGVEGNSGTLIRRGDYDALVAARPAAGTLISTMGAMLNVVSTRLVKGRGGLGTLYIQLGDGDVTGEGLTTAADRTETTELDYSLMEKRVSFERSSFPEPATSSSRSGSRSPSRRLSGKRISRFQKPTTRIRKRIPIGRTSRTIPRCSTARKSSRA